MKERSLVLFTLITPTAAGAFWASTALLAFQHRQPTACLQLFYKLLFALAVLGLLASFSHLGAPRKAWYALANLRSSWLSREIAFSMLFTGSLGLCAVMDPALLAASWGTAALLFTGICGIAFVYSMEHVYLLRTVAPWNTSTTRASFWGAACILGVLTTAGFDASVCHPTSGAWAGAADVPIPAPWQLLAWFAILLISIRLLLAVRRKLPGSSLPRPVFSLVRRLDKFHTGLLLVTCLILIISLAVSLTRPVPQAILPLLLWLALGAAGFGEAAGRLAFYEMRRQVGLTYPLDR